MMNVLHPRPLARIALRLGKPGAQIRSPFGFVAREKSSRIERTQSVAADALVVLQDETQFRLIREIRADKDSAQRVGVFTVKRFAVLPVVSRLQANMIGPGLIARPRGANGAIVHSAEL